MHIVTYNSQEIIFCYFKKSQQIFLLKRQTAIENWNLTTVYRYHFVALQCSIKNRSFTSFVYDILKYSQVYIYRKWNHLLWETNKVKVCTQKSLLLDMLLNYFKTLEHSHDVLKFSDNMIFWISVILLADAVGDNKIHLRDNTIALISRII